MSDWPTLSVVIPSFNNGAFIERTLLSILGQDYPGKVEVIVADGGSKDGTVEILRRYEDRVLWHSEPDRGFVDAVGKGMRRATGEIVAIQSSDDYYLQGTFRAAIGRLGKNPELAFVGGASVCIDPDGNVRELKQFDGPMTPRTVLFEFTPRQEATFVRRSCFDAVGGLRAEVDICADKDLWFRILHRYPGRVFPDVWAVFQLHPGQRTRSSAEWLDGITRMVESCEADPTYGKIFRLGDAEKRNLFTRLRIFWTARVDPNAAAEFARHCLPQIATFDRPTQALIRRHADNATLTSRLRESMQGWRQRRRLAAISRLDLDWWFKQGAR